MSSTADLNYASSVVAHNRLRRRPVLFASIAVVHTLLTAGIVFGWASLLPILKNEGVEMSATEFTRVFTHGAVGNYLSSLPFGFILDKFGPRKLGITASILFATGLWLCSMVHTSPLCLDVGFSLLGFSGPAIQLPGLHLARLFPGDPVEGGSGGAAAFMSAQAAAFDGGTVVFCLFSIIASIVPTIPLITMFRVYLIVPAFTLGTSVFYWPNTILPDPSALNGNKPQTPRSRSNSYVATGSPYLSPKTVQLQEQQLKDNVANTPLRDQPLQVVLSKLPFYCLAAWVAVHILKLNFVVATINDQLDQQVVLGHLSTDQESRLIQIFGAMLPFGFVVLPIVAYLLNKSVMLCFQVANTVGVMYGAVLAFFPSQSWYLVGIVFSAVSTSRQLVYSTVFHQTGELFGFENYGVLLGLTNVAVSAVSMCQTPLVDWAQYSSNGYLGPNLALFALTLPLFGIIYGTKPPTTAEKSNNQQYSRPVNESTSLIPPSTSKNGKSRPRSISDAGL